MSNSRSLEQLDVFPSYKGGRTCVYGGYVWEFRPGHHLQNDWGWVAQHRLVDVKSTAELVLGLYDQVHVGMLLVGVQCHHIPVLQREFLPGKYSGCGEHLLGRRRRRHRQHDVVHELHRARSGVSMVLPPILTG